jgi:DNA-binding MarR family transcriptional regulator/predicted N-acetyltransferase YhbS
MPPSITTRDGEGGEGTPRVDASPTATGSVGPDARDGDAAAIVAVRRFNRFYTRQIGLLDEGMLQTRFSLTEMRVLYELAHHDDLTATGLAEELGLDPGYLSRLLKGLQSDGLLERRPAPADARQALLAITAAGREAFRPLDEGTKRQIAALLAPLAPVERDALTEAMQRIESLLAGTRGGQAPWLLREPRAGDFGWIIHRQAVIYRDTYGWDATFEALIADIVAAFIRTQDPRKERAWVAERDGRILGSIFAVRESDEVCKLRLLYVEPEARGLGIGGRLVTECIAFARERGYRKLTLWTNDILVSARRIYEAAGFRLESEETHRSFGHDLVGQCWTLALR